MEMTSSKENFTPEFRSTFQKSIDQDGFLICQEDLECRELDDKAIIVLRTSKDHNKNIEVVNECFGVDLPEALCISTGNNNIKCLWISPDEFWLVDNRQNKVGILDKIELLSEDISMIDNSAAYGVLEFSGKKKHSLLARWMSYDLGDSLSSKKVVSTTLGQAPVIVFRDVEDKLLMLVRHSFSHYVAGLLKDSAKRI
jgi:sarcosine oxidase subunit gamma